MRNTWPFTVVGLMGVLLIPVRYAEAQPVDNIVATLSVPPFGTARSPAIKASEGQILVVRAKVEDELAPAVFIYDEAGQLHAKNEETAASSTFDWQVRNSGSFEVVIYSNTDAPVDYSVLLLPKPKDRATQDSSPPLAVMNLFWASNRKVSGRSPVRLEAAASDGNVLAYGTCEVSIPRVHKRGLLEGPSLLRLEFAPNPDRHVVFLRDKTRILRSEQFFEELRKYSLRSTEQDALVLIHGFNVDFESAARRAGQLAYDLQFRGPTVVFSWPSQGALDPVSYNKDRSNAELSAEPLRQLVDHIRLKAGAKRIHILAHSMGSVPLTRALAEMPDATGIQQIALLAPDIEARMFEQLARRFPRAGIGGAPKVTLYASDKDMALKLSSAYSGGTQRAGQGSPEVVIVPGVDTIDASSVDTSLLGVFHQYFADNTQILADIFALLRGTAPENRFGLNRRETQRGLYYVFVPSVR